MIFTRDFKDITKEDAADVGGKGASLGEMTRNGIPVPPGFVVRANAFEEHVREAGILDTIEEILKKTDASDIESLEKTSDEIRELIFSHTISPLIAEEIKEAVHSLDTLYVAVRSSATAEDGVSYAWAGQLESYLYVKKTDVLEHIQKCWASLFTPRALFYRSENGLSSTHIGVAVVIQKMVDAEVSGIGFTVHPITQDADTLLIEAGFGLGEAVVSGAVTPDSYTVVKESNEITDITVHTQMRALVRGTEGGVEWQFVQCAREQKLSSEQIVTLARLMKNIERDSGFPCDIEWAFEKGQFYIVQSRPITTLGSRHTGQPTHVFTRAYTRNFPMLLQEVWYRAHTEGLRERLALFESPHLPYLYHMKDGVVEVWENKDVVAALIESVVDRVVRDETFFDEVHTRYSGSLVGIKKWWEQDIQTSLDLRLFLKHMEQVVPDFLILYASLLDERVLARHRVRASAFREKDDFFARCAETIWKALDALYPELGPLSGHLLLHEIDTPVDVENLQTRDAGFICVPGVHADIISFSQFTVSHPEYRFHIETGSTEDGIVTGQSAFPGRVFGRVRIVKRRDQIPTLLEGEVLVSPMTTPDMVPAMKKAVAFVTDEGGVMCHAAIIAREMQKTCVIGTKNATEIFVDGDLVEVDARNGVVRRISQ